MSCIHRWLTFRWNLLPGVNVTAKYIIRKTILHNNRVIDFPTILVLLIVFIIFLVKLIELFVHETYRFWIFLLSTNKCSTYVFYSVSSTMLVTSRQSWVTISNKSISNTYLEYKMPFSICILNRKKKTILHFPF